jgi:hypothetical protein
MEKPRIKPNCLPAVNRDLPRLSLALTTTQARSASRRRTGAGNSELQAPLCVRKQLDERHRRKQADKVPAVLDLTRLVLTGRDSFSVV